jgi:hypothetical protein
MVFVHAHGFCRFVRRNNEVDVAIILGFFIHCGILNISDSQILVQEVVFQQTGQIQYLPHSSCYSILFIDSGSNLGSNTPGTIKPP